MSNTFPPLHGAFTTCAEPPSRSVSWNLLEREAPQPERVARGQARTLTEPETALQPNKETGGCQKGANANENPLQVPAGPSTRLQGQILLLPRQGTRVCSHLVSSTDWYQKTFASIRRGTIRFSSAT